MRMSERKVGIVAECVCDLPRSMLKDKDIGLVYFLIDTDRGTFTDTDEITAENIIEYMNDGGQKSISTAPSAEVYVKAFEKQLKNYDEVLLVCISSGISDSVANATKAVEKMGERGKRIRIFDSGHLSTGLGFLVLHGAELAEKGMTADEIIPHLEELKERVSTSFLAKNASHLYRKGLVAKWVKVLCELLNIHPVLFMKNGRLALKRIEIGDYTSSMKRYIRSQLKGGHGVDKRCCFITHVGCGVKRTELIKKTTNKCCSFDELIMTKASATISSNCGPDTFGVMFVRSK